MIDISTVREHILSKGMRLFVGCRRIVRLSWLIRGILVFFLKMRTVHFGGHCKFCQDLGLLALSIASFDGCVRLTLLLPVSKFRTPVRT